MLSNCLINAHVYTHKPELLSELENIIFCSVWKSMERCVIDQNAKNKKLSG